MYVNKFNKTRVKIFYQKSKLLLTLIVKVCKLAQLTSSTTIFNFQSVPIIFLTFNGLFFQFFDSGSGSVSKIRIRIQEASDCGSGSVSGLQLQSDGAGTSKLFACVRPAF